VFTQVSRCSFRSLVLGWFRSGAKASAQGFVTWAAVKVHVRWSSRTLVSVSVRCSGEYSLELWSQLFVRLSGYYRRIGHVSMMQGVVGGRLPARVTSSIELPFPKGKGGCLFDNRSHFYTDRCIYKPEFVNLVPFCFSRHLVVLRALRSF
jgi:hypothetical protein